MEKVLDVERDGGPVDGAVLVHGPIICHVRPNSERNRFTLSEPNTAEIREREKVEEEKEEVEEEKEEEGGEEE